MKHLIAAAVLLTAVSTSAQTVARNAGTSASVPALPPSALVAPAALSGGTQLPAASLTGALTLPSSFPAPIVADPHSLGAHVVDAHIKPGSSAQAVAEVAAFAPRGAKITLVDSDIVHAVLKNADEAQLLALNLAQSPRFGKIGVHPAGFQSLQELPRIKAYADASLRLKMAMMSAMFDGSAAKPDNMDRMVAETHGPSFNRPYQAPLAAVPATPLQRAKAEVARIEREIYDDNHRNGKGFMRTGALTMLLTAAALVPAVPPVLKILMGVGAYFFLFANFSYSMGWKPETERGAYRALAAGALPSVAIIIAIVAIDTGRYLENSMAVIALAGLGFAAGLVRFMMKEARAASALRAARSRGDGGSVHSKLLLTAGALLALGLLAVPIAMFLFTALNAGGLLQFALLAGFGLISLGSIGFITAVLSRIRTERLRDEEQRRKNAAATHAIIAETLKKAEDDLRRLGDRP